MFVLSSDSLFNKRKTTEIRGEKESELIYSKTTAVVACEVTQYQSWLLL